jgi:hypothetical protein
MSGGSMKKARPPKFYAADTTFEGRSRQVLSDTAGHERRPANIARSRTPTRSTKPFAVY